MAEWVGAIGTWVAAIGIFVIAAAEWFERRSLRRDATHRACAAFFRPIGSAVALLLVCREMKAEFDANIEPFVNAEAIRRQILASPMRYVSGAADLAALPPQLAERVMLVESAWADVARRLELHEEPSTDYFATSALLQRVLDDLEPWTRQTGEALWQEFQPGSTAPWKQFEMSRALERAQPSEAHE